MWSYLCEDISISHTFQQTQGFYKITENVRCMRHLFIWIINNSRIAHQNHNSNIHDTFRIGVNDGAVGSVKFSSLQLVVRGTRYLPTVTYDADVSCIYRDTMQYQVSYHNDLKHLLISRESFESLYGVYYWNLENLDDNVKEGTISLDLCYQTDGAVANLFCFYCITLSEEEVKINVTQGRATIQT